MEARADADGVRRERLPLRRRDPAGKDHGGGSGPPLLHVRRPDPGGGDGDDTEWSNKRCTFFLQTGESLMDQVNFRETEIFWVEKRKDFVKLCFGFSPEIHEELKPLGSIYEKIEERIQKNHYKSFSVWEDKNNKMIVVANETFQINGVVTVLIPTTQKVDGNIVQKLFYEKGCNLDKIYRSFYSSELHEIQKYFTGSFILSHNLAIHCTEFSSCPIKNISRYNISAYSVDIYGDDVQKMIWDLQVRPS